MASNYEAVAQDAIKILKSGGGISLTEWKKSCNKLGIYTLKRPNNIREYKNCPKQTFLWIVKYILCDASIIVDIDIDNKNGLYAGIAINELLKNDNYLKEDSSKLWNHIRSLPQTRVDIVENHNAQMDVVKGLWGEISKIPKDTIKSRLKNAGIQDV